ncbi:flavin-dependent dehydrogenase [Evansella vedderi]|uniref:Flavin-dependent dehydrogenase n=1 Tax=Evansella vedderi TaxID=38282 RepID=A0ABT9ZWJ9_9BACI|nr:FAD-dependent oxidoreductase [Evansella vedderi]MDQ0255131.1 flavin-dependent dehydrogenase [Evansella vedderi]
MKVAIMGAGLSGLACALTLEQNGIQPTIYEKRRGVGDRFINGEAMLSILTRPVQDPIRYLGERFHIYLKPTSHINELMIHSPNSSASVKEHLGFINIRGRHEQSYENQLAEQMKSEIIFHSNKSYEELSQEYSHVIIATGDAAYADEMGNFQNDLTVTIKGATIVGDFSPYSVPVWLDYEVAPKGYGYFLPFSHNEGNMAIAFPEYGEISQEELSRLWDNFMNKVCNHFNQTVKVTDQFQITGYQIGRSKLPRIGNTFFTGNCFGSIMPFLGFGQFASILTGVYAANDILGNGVYEELTQHLRKSYQNSLVLRQGLEALSNGSVDFLVNQLNHEITKKIFTKNSHNPLGLLSFLLRPFVNRLHLPNKKR